jgi:small subunit ribosomal protein S2
MSAYQDISLRELMEAGAHFGHQSRRWNPKMKPYIFQSKDNIHVIDLGLTAQGLREACEYVHDLTAAGGIVLFVGTKRQAKELLKTAAVDAAMPYVVERWVGGMLTNWDTILKNIARLKEFKRKTETGELAQYTKKEQSLIAKEMDKLEKVYEGLMDLDRIPDAIFIVDVRKEKIAVKEAKRRGIPVIGVCDTNCDPSLVDIVIAANDDAIKSVEYIVTKLSNAASAGKVAKSKGDAPVAKSADSDEVEKPKKKAKVEDKDAVEEKPKKRASK